MGLKRIIVLSLVLPLFFGVQKSNGAWEGPTEIISGIWGNGVQQFGVEHGDSGDTFPLIEAITPDNKIVITDMVNKKQIVYGFDGSFIKEAQWLIKSQSGGTTYYDIAEYSFGAVAGYSGDGNIYTGSKNKYSLRSLTGQLLKTYAERPLELGRVSEQSLGGGKYRITITYPDRTYALSKGPYSKYVRDSKGYINAISGKGVEKFSACGKLLATLVIPDNQRNIIRPAGGGFEEESELIVGFGEPVVAPTGDVYTWKRTPDKYSIVKWTWQDDPNMPSGPDAPTGLAVVPSTTGLYLTWKASPQDSGCVTGYEIARATSSGGLYTTLATVDKGVLKDNDTTAVVGTTYYYKVRAVSGADYSPYTAEASGKR